MCNGALLMIYMHLLMNYTVCNSSKWFQKNKKQVIAKKQRGGGGGAPTPESAYVTYCLYGNLLFAALTGHHIIPTLMLSL